MAPSKCISNKLDGSKCTFNSKPDSDYCGFHMRDKPMIKTEDSCSICLDDVVCDDVCMIDCKHIYHGHCIRKWYNDNNMCPICRNTITTLTYNKNPSDKQIIKELLESITYLKTVIHTKTESNILLADQIYAMQLQLTDINQYDY